MRDRRRRTRRRAAPAPCFANGCERRRSSSVRTMSTEPKRRGSLRLSRRPSSVSITTWSCLPISAGIDPPASRHAEMEDHRVAAVGLDQPIFGAPAEPGDARAGQPLAQVRRERPAQIRRGAARSRRSAGPSAPARGRAPSSRPRAAQACSTMTRPPLLEARRDGQGLFRPRGRRARGKDAAGARRLLERRLAATI